MDKYTNIYIYKYLDDGGHLSNSQFGFVSGKNTEDALLKVLNLVMAAINENKKVLALFLDISKAFDSVNHQIMQKS